MTAKYTRRVATNMVIANMIGTGIFTSLGFQIVEDGIPDPFAILTIWLLGGLVSLCGATVYGEVASRINRSGGEYAFLSEIYHPILGFMSGWVSMFVGFSAAIATLALATGEYFLPVLGYAKETMINLGIISLAPSKVIGALLLIVVAVIQLNGVRTGGRFQNVLTYVKLALIASFLILPFFLASNYQPSGISFAPTENTLDTIFSLPFAGALVWVMFSYSGWNASSYIVGNLENPKRNLPFSLIVGTLIVTVIYMLLNTVFMYVATPDELAGQLDIGNIVALKVLGADAGLIFSCAFSLALISGVNAMFIAGPRVAEQIGNDYRLFHHLSKSNKKGAPVYAILCLLIISLSLVVFSSFKEIIEYISLTLALFSLLTVAGVFILRFREKKSGAKPDSTSIKAWGYPFTPILFIVVTLWMISYFVKEEPMRLVWALVTFITSNSYLFHQ